MKTIFISDIINLIGSFIENYEDVKALRHTCVSTFYLRYNVGVYSLNNFKYKDRKSIFNKIKNFSCSYNLVSLKNNVAYYYCRNELMFIVDDSSYIYSNVINIIIDNDETRLSDYSFHFKNLKKITIIMSFNAAKSFEFMNQNYNSLYKFDVVFADKEFEYYFKIHKIMRTISLNNEGYNLLECNAKNGALHYRNRDNFIFPLCFNYNILNKKYILDIETLKPHPDSPNQIDISHLFDHIIKPSPPPPPQAV